MRSTADPIAPPIPPELFAVISRADDDRSFSRTPPRLPRHMQFTLPPWASAPSARALRTDQTCRPMVCVLVRSGRNGEGELVLAWHRLEQAAMALGIIVLGGQFRSTKWCVVSFYRRTKRCSAPDASTSIAPWVSQAWFRPESEGGPLAGCASRLRGFHPGRRACDSLDRPILPSPDYPNR